MDENNNLVMMHHDLCSILETAVCYDQLDMPALASMELLVRQIQIIEERFKDRFMQSSSSSQDFDRHLMSGNTSRTQICVCPELIDWLAKESSKTTAIDKERRKAREERALLQKAPKQKKGADDG